MNILIFNHSYEAPFVDVNDQFTQVFDKNDDVTVVYLTGEPNEDIRKRHATKNVIFLNYSKKAIAKLKWAPIKKMLALQREKKFDIVICHRFKPTYIMLWVAKFSPIPQLISVMHAFNAFHSFHRKCSLLLLAPKNLYIAGVSNAVRDDIRRDVWRIPKESIITLYNAINIEATEKEVETRNQARQLLNIPKESFIFGTMGRLVKEKDHASLIQAFSFIKRDMPNAKLIIMGKGKLELELKKQIQTLGLENDVSLIGFVPRSFRLIRAFDVFVFPSIEEPFGRALIEVMIAKIPIITTKVHGIPEVIGDTCTLIEAKNPVQLAEKMLEYYRMPKVEHAEQTERAYARVKTHFSIESFKEAFWKIFKNPF